MNPRGARRQTRQHPNPCAVPPNAHKRGRCKDSRQTGKPIRAAGVRRGYAMKRPKWRNQSMREA